MDKYKSLLLIIFYIGLVCGYTACSSNVTYITDDNTDATISATSDTDSDDDAEDDIDIGNNDAILPGDDNDVETPDYSLDADYLSIVYNGTDVTILNPYPDVLIEQSGAHVTIRGVVANMVCKISGSSENGSFKLYGTEPIILIFNGVSLTNPISPAINIQSHKRVDLVLAEDSNNYLCDGGVYETIPDEDAKSTLFSEGQLIVSGTGTLHVQSYYAHAIASDNYIKIESGNIVVTETFKDAIHCNTGFVLNNGSLDLKATDDAIQVDEGNITINGGSIFTATGDDGIVSAYEGSDISIASGIEINGGSITINTTGDKGMAIKSTSDIVINGGDIVLDTKGKGAKGISCDGDCNISGGTFDVTTSGGVYYISSSDKSTAAGIKCDGNLTIVGGVMEINSSGAGGKGINVDGTAMVSDGVITINTSGSEQYSSKAKAFKSEGDMTINGGSLLITTQKDGAEGLESKGIFTINGGEVCVETYDDAINAGKKVLLNGGKLYVYSSNNDAIDCNSSSSGSIAINGAYVVACSNAGAPEGPLDSDHGNLSVTAGYLFTMGAEHAVPTTSTAKQNTILFSNFAVAKGDYLTVFDANGKVVMALCVPCDRYTRGSNSTMVTSPDIESGLTYSIGVSLSAPLNYSDEWKNFYIGGECSDEPKILSSMTVSSSYNGSAGVSGPGGPGGGPGGGFRPW